MRSRIARLFGAAMLASMVIVLPSVEAHAATVCHTFVSSATLSGNTLTAKGAAFCSGGGVYAQRVYVRIYRTDVSPADSLAGNGQVCYGGTECPKGGSASYVTVSAGLKNGCHTYEARSGGWYTPLGEPPAIQYDSVRDTLQFNNGNEICR